MDIRNQDHSNSNSNSEKPAQTSCKAGCEKRIELRAYADEDGGLGADLLAVLAKVSDRLNRKPELLGRGATCYRLECAAGEAYEPAFGPVERVTVAFRDDGVVYDLSEHNSRGGSGGWAGSSIPHGRLRRFFTAWLEQTDPNAVQQLGLFA